MTPFDHVNAIQTEKALDYFDNLPDEDRKVNVYMVLRILSMNYDYLPLVNAFQRSCTNPGPRETFLFFQQALPKGKKYSKYIKRSVEEKLDSWVVELIARWYKISIAEAESYMSIMLKTDAGRAEITWILEAYGTDEKKIKRLKL